MFHDAMASLHISMGELRVLIPGMEFDRTPQISYNLTVVKLQGLHSQNVKW
jgi:hypothetical protein